MDAIKVLIQYGSDPMALNAFGLNMLHTASQGDSAAPLHYFRKRGVDINQQDQRGSTPLHWACYSTSEIALSFLLAWQPDLNIRDSDGFTPLHLAVKSVDTVESTRPVRFLMIRGADKEVQDNNGNTPLDLVNNGEVMTENLARDLRKMLGPAGLCECLLLTTPTRLIKRNARTMVVYLLTTFIVLTIEFFFVFPCKYTTHLIPHD